jgi:nitrite reductase/ring-hydroxylating ferredoxin subunit
LLDSDRLSGTWLSGGLAPTWLGEEDVHVNRPKNDSSSTETPLPTRRGFCLHACQLASLAAVGGALQACGGSPTSPSINAPALPVITSNVTNGVITLPLDASSPLATVGNAALVRASGNELLVARTGQTVAVSLTAVCTHENCTISGYTEGKYVCPCHGSQYTTEGNVLSGPATRALRQFTTTISGSSLTITL